MPEREGEQWTEPTNKPSEEHGETYNTIKETNGQEIISGARQEDQLDALKPDPEADEKIESQPVSHVNNGDQESLRGDQQ